MSDNTPTRIWWCEEHQSSSRHEPTNGITHQCDWDAMTAQLDAQNPWVATREVRCKIVARTLVEVSDES